MLFITSFIASFFAHIFATKACEIKRESLVRYWKGQMSHSIHRSSIQFDTKILEVRNSLCHLCTASVSKIGGWNFACSLDLWRHWFEAMWGRPPRPPRPSANLCYYSWIFVIPYHLIRIDVVNILHAQHHDCASDAENRYADILDTKCPPYMNKAASNSLFKSGFV